MVDLADITGFDWDEGNIRKNEKHSVSMAEAEQLFFNQPLLILEDSKHSNQEPRFHALGKSDDNRQLHITFTLRQAGEKIRVISVRDMHKKSERYMKKHLKPIPQFADEKEEQLFWEQNDSSDYFDWSKASKVVMPNLRPTTKTISLRLPQHLLDSIKSAAHARDVPYQSLIKVWLQEKLNGH
jgi:hypothetical protein